MVDRLADFTAECRRRVAGELRDDLFTRVLYSSDASLYQLMPLAVLIPRTVSYTHLDVYKRQSRRCAGRPSRRPTDARDCEALRC